MIGGLFSHVGAPTDKINVLLDGFSSGNHWTVDLEMGHLYNPASTSSEDVPFVLSILEMWDTFEHACESFSEEDKEFVLADTESESALREIGKQPESREIKFDGFSATSESDLVKIAVFLVEKMHSFPRFNGRNIGSNQKNTYQANKMKLVLQSVNAKLGRKTTFASRSAQLLTKMSTFVRRSKSSNEKKQSVAS